MKILFVLENYYPNIGGVETLFKNLAEQLVSLDHEVTIITTLPNKETPRYEKEGNLTIRRLHFWNRYFFTFLGFFPLLKYVHQFDLVHTTSYNAGVPAFFAAKLFNKKVIITFHEVWGDLWFRLPYFGKIAKWGHYLFEQFLLKLPFDHFVAVSKSTKESLEENGILSTKISVIYNGIDYSEFPTKTTKATNTSFTYTYFGRLGISKGLDILLDAAIDIKKTIPNSSLKIIIPKVPITFFKTILKTIKQKELQDHIKLLHYLPFKELQNELRASDCVVIPSYSEGFCFAAVECIAMQIPIISSDQMALREVVSGTFIKMKEHSDEALTRAIKQAVRKEWEYTPIKRFTLKNTIKNYLDLYQKLQILSILAITLCFNSFTLNIFLLCESLLLQML